MKNEKLWMSQGPGSHLTMDTHTDAAMQEGINNDGSETCDEAEEACSSNIVGANNDDASDIIKKDLESSTAEEESYVEGSDCRNNDADQEATTDRVSRSDAGISRDLDNDLESESNRNGPLPEVQEDVLSSNSTSNNSAFLAVLRSEEEKQEEVERQGNTIDRLSRQDASSNEHEESRARVLNPSTDPGGEQIVPRNRKMPALSEKQQIQTLGPVGAFAEGQGEHSDLQVGTSPAASKRSYHTLAPANGVAACQQAGAFREDRVEQSGLQVGTTRLPGASKPSRGLEEDTSGNEQDEESAVMIIHATLVVEEGSETRRQDSYSSSTIEVRSNNDIAVEDGSATGRENRHSPSTRDERSNVNDDIAASYINSNVVVENVIMDEHLAEHPRNPELVEATLLNDQKTTIWCQHRKTWIFAVGVVAVLAIIISIAVVFGVNSSDDKEVGNTMESFVRDVLPGFSQSELEDPTSDQSLALAWLWKDPNATSRLPNFRRVQRFALATAFFAMANSIDQENIERTTWLTEDHECTWQTNDSPITVCDNEEFETFSVSEFALNGTIPPEIGLLTKLVSIDISDNHVYGTLPSELGYLSRMDQFMATNCALTGLIPTELSLWTDLRMFSLSNNQLTSTIPTELGRLATLQRLDLDYNTLTGTLPSEIGQLSELRFLFLHNNNLTGVIPTEFGRIPHLAIVILAENFMNGTLPAALGSLTTMIEMHFHGNQFSGTIPKELGGLLELETFTLHDTRLTGSVPSAVCELVDSAALEHLTVDCTEISCFCNCECLDNSTG